MSTDRDDTRYPPLDAYAFIGDCHSAALISRHGSIDWCCGLRIDAASVFARLLDWDKGGHCALMAEGDVETSRRYVPDTMVLETQIRAADGEAVVYDGFLAPGRRGQPANQLVRIVDCQRGHLIFRLDLAPRFDYGSIEPWIRRHGPDAFSAVGGDNALIVTSDSGLELVGHHDLAARVDIRSGERWRLAIGFAAPESIDADPPVAHDRHEIDDRLASTFRWWRTWAGRLHYEGPDADGVKRSALVLKALTNDSTGAVAAAPTTSLPEDFGGTRNWDYRYSWVRDSQIALRALASVGARAEAEAFRRFVERSAAGSADGLQVVYGLRGERRLAEYELTALEGYAKSAPVRIGNDAGDQRQLDVAGHLLELSWQWHEQGSSPDDDYWRFIVSVVDSTVDNWQAPDRGMWETRCAPRHHTHSKAMCWVALDRGIRLADACMRAAPVDTWRTTRDRIRAAIESEGWNDDVGAFVQAFGSDHLDAAALLLPTIGFLDHDDDRMRSTVDTLLDRLDDGGLLRRYDSDDGLPGHEGAFLASSFWMVECLAHQGRLDAAHRRYDRALDTANDLGLFAEEYDTAAERPLGNFPQALTHLSHITAALALYHQPGARSNW